MDKNLKAFLNVLDARDNSTGGGTASSVAGAMAAGLAAMVSRLSMDKEDLYPTEHYAKYASQAEEMAQALFDGGREDAEAFARVSAAYKQPQTTVAEKKARSRAIQAAMIHAAQVPLKNARCIKAVLVLCYGLQEKYNTNAASDLACAIYLAQAGLKGCVANVRINLPYIKDETVCRDLENELQALLSDMPPA